MQGLYRFEYWKNGRALNETLNKNDFDLLTAAYGWTKFLPGKRIFKE